MLPVLLDIGFFKIYTQGIFLVLAFFWASFMLWKHVALTSYKEEDVFDLIFVSLFGGLLFGRIIYVGLHFNDFGFNLVKFFLINGYPGIHGMAAILGFFLFLYIFSFWKKMDMSKSIDYFISPMFLALAIAKIGSFFSGSEVGTQTKFLIAIKYPALDGARHLTSIYQSIFFFLGSFLAHRFLMQIRREKFSNGFNFFFFLGYYGLILALFDPITAFRTVVFGWSFELIISVLLLLTASIYFIYYFRKFILRYISFKRLIPNKSHKS